MKYTDKFEKFGGRRGFRHFFLETPEEYKNNYVRNMEWKGDISGESELYLLMEVEYVDFYYPNE